MAETHKGRCFCGAVELEVTGAPALQGYCHCESCRSWSAGPVNAFSLWPPAQVKVTKGADKIASFAKTEQSHRKWCKTCGGHVFTEHPGFGLTDVYAATIPSFGFKPMMHVFYGESVLPIRDGLPKFKDLPGDVGGSGETLAE